ncbi:DEAD/DEAH box helicase family protein [Dactylosporangium sp. NPDC000244]|uniref:DEAD/DEAH box helicase family protein n=1 Tax=Dactylosporangium sp. NPDC000244 TaxID=3154365 RepID=UPI00331A8468
MLEHGARRGAGGGDSGVIGHSRILHRRDSDTPDGLLAAPNFLQDPDVALKCETLNTHWSVARLNLSYPCAIVDGTMNMTPDGDQPSSRRRFGVRERGALFLASNGSCTDCGAPLSPGWHADHMRAYARGGATDISNGQALCPTCNLRKGTTPVTELRQWQRRATDKFYGKNTRDFLVSATPGAGKTRFALALANRLLDERTVTRVVVVVPTDALRQQWADQAAAAGLSLMPVTEPEDYDKAGYQGCVATYAQIARGAGADLLRRATRVPTIAILDEIHHAGDNKAWGDGLTNALEQATVRLALTGTPWRRDPTSPIPFVDYDENGTVQVDYAYEYGTAVADGVCRRIEFHAYDGEAKWIDCGKVATAALGANLADDDVSAALDAIYDPAYKWMPVLLRQAVEALNELRQEIPDAAGLVVAERQWQAQAYAKILNELTGKHPIVVVSDDPDAKAAIDRFRSSHDTWIVAVKMVSEGVDIPRLGVGVYASKTRTPLFFRQVVGRFVRTRPNEEFNAKLFIPAVPALTEHARQIEEELRHQLELETERAKRQAAEGEFGGEQGALNFREPLSASEAVFDRAILGGKESTPEEVERAAAECRRLGIPTQYAMNLLTYMREKAQPEASGDGRQREEIAEPRHRRERMLRQEIDTLAGKVSYRTGTDKKQVNTELLKAGFPPRAKASVEQLEAMRDELARWLSAARP